MWMPKLTISPSKLHSALKPVCCHPLHALRGLVLLNHQGSSVMIYVWTGPPRGLEGPQGK